MKVGILSAVLVVSSLVLLLTPHNASGIGAGGCDVNVNGKVDSYEYCSSWGWGWVEYAVTGGGPNGGFSHTYNPQGYTWPGVSSLCTQKGANFVWMFTASLKDTSTRRVFGMQATGAASKDYGTDPETVHTYFNSPQKTYDNGNIWSTSPSGGQSLGWFCYNSIPPPVDFTLVPAISNVNQTIAEAGSPVNVTPAVANTGHASSSGTKWQITTFEVAPGGTVPLPAINGSIPCTYYDPSPPSGTSCVIEANNSGVGKFGVGSSQYTGSSGSAFGVKSLTIGDYPVGTKVCYALSVQPYANTSSNWSHSAPVCVVIGKQPFVQVWGGDLLGAGSVTTSTTTKSGKTFGSWVEYGIFAVKNIVGTGSGSAYVGQGLANATICNESLLSFTNAANSTGCKTTGTIGNYTNSASLPNVAASFPIITTGTKNLTPTLGSDDLSDQAKSGIFTATGNLTLNGATIGAPSGQPGAGRWVVLNAPTANVTITGNITYADGPYTGIADIPQLIIIANNITIADSVTQVDAWLITSGVLSTCTFTSKDSGYASFPAFPPFPSISSTVTPPAQKLDLTINTCNQQLTVNGPVMAQSLDLLRTKGSDPGVHSGDPAEVFNLRPDAYLWSQAHSIQTGRLQTSYTTELPPRL